MHLFNSRAYLSFFSIVFFSSVCVANDSGTLALFEFKKDTPVEVDRPILPLFEIKNRSRAEYEDYLDSLGPWQEKCAETEGSSTACVVDRPTPEESKRWDIEEKEMNRRKEKERAEIAEICKNVKWDELNLDQRRQMQIICGLKPDGSPDENAELFKEVDVMFKRLIARSRARKGPQDSSSGELLRRHLVPASIQNAISAHERNY